jgi:hypothetical protein
VTQSITTGSQKHTNAPGQCPLTRLLPAVLKESKRNGGRFNGFDSRLRESVGNHRFFFSLVCTYADTRTPTCARRPPRKKGGPESDLLNIIWSDDGQDIAEYTVMRAVILVLVVGTIRLDGLLQELTA